jgi:hypothetical protein
MELAWNALGVNTRAKGVSLERLAIIIAAKGDSLDLPVGDHASQASLLDIHWGQ